MQRTLFCFWTGWEATFIIQFGLTRHTYWIHWLCWGISEMQSYCCWTVEWCSPELYFLAPSCGFGHPDCLPSAWAPLSLVPPSEKHTVVIKNVGAQQAAVTGSVCDMVVCLKSSHLCDVVSLRSLLFPLRSCHWKGHDLETFFHRVNLG